MLEFPLLFFLKIYQSILIVCDWEKDKFLMVQNSKSLDELAKFYKIIFSGTSKCGCFWASSIPTCNFCSRPAFIYLRRLTNYLKSFVISSKWPPLSFQLIQIQKSCWNTLPCILRPKLCLVRYFCLFLTGGFANAFQGYETFFAFN